MDVKLTLIENEKEMPIIEGDIWFFLNTVIIGGQIKNRSNLKLYVDGKEIPRPVPCECEDCR